MKLFTPLFNQPRKIAAIGLALLLVILLIGLSYRSGEHARAKFDANQAQQIVQAISVLNSEVNDLKTLDITTSQTFQGKVNQQVQSAWQQVSDSLGQLGTQNTTLQGQTVQVIDATHQETLQKIAGLNANLQAIKKAVTPPAYLNESALPFHVLGLDYWNGEPKLTITLNNQNDLIGQGETRNGWTIIQINPDNHNVIFQNANHQMVKVGV